MQLSQIARYPVKSLQGEFVSRLQVEANGLHGDRTWGIHDETTGKILTGRRAPELLFASASLTSDGSPLITLPSGETCAGPGAATDAALSDWLGKPVRLVSATDGAPARAEYFEDATDDASTAIEWTMPAGRFVDALPLLVLTTASLRAGAAHYPSGDWQLRRFRPNLVLDLSSEGWVEDTWCRRATLRIGDVALQPQEPCMRCTMVTREQPGVGEDRDIFRTLARHHRGHFGAWTSVITGGTVEVGDPVLLDVR
jgi:hypothetical protein